MRIAGEGLNTHSGAFDVAGGATLGWSGGTHTVASATGIRRKPATSGDATGTFSGSNVTLNAPYDMQRTNAFGGAASFNGATSTGPIVLSGGRADFNTDISPPSIELSENGTLGGSAVVTVPSFVWTGGFQDTPNSGFSNNQPGTGATVITGSLTMDRPDSNPDPNAHNPIKTLNRLLRIAPGATAVLRGNNGANNRGYLNLAGGSHLSGRLENQGTLAIEQDQDIHGGVRGVQNTGTITKSSSGGETIITPSLDQDGQLTIDGGRLRTENLASYDQGTETLGGGAYRIKGTLAIGGGSMRFNAARLDLDGAAAKVDDSHTVQAEDGLVNFRGNTATGDLRILGGQALTAPSACRPIHQRRHAHHRPHQHPHGDGWPAEQRHPARRRHGGARRRRQPDGDQRGRRAPRHLAGAADRERRLRPDLGRQARDGDRGHQTRAPASTSSR